MTAAATWADLIGHKAHLVGHVRYSNLDPDHGIVTSVSLVKPMGPDLH